MKRLLLPGFISCSLLSCCYCQPNTLLPKDSLLKLNKVKKAYMVSRQRAGNGTSQTVYDYNENGDLTRSAVITSLTNRPFIITDYLFDKSGVMYESLTHGSEEYESYRSSQSGYSMTWQPRFADSISFYYEYDNEKKLSRIFRKYPSGELMNETVYTYHPLTVTRKAYDRRQHLTGEFVGLYEKEEFVVRTMEKSYDSTGKIILTSIQEFENTYNAAGQVTEVNYKNDSCSCISYNKYYANGLVKRRTNIGCKWDKKFRYKYYRK